MKHEYTPEENAIIIGSVIDMEPEEMEDIVIIVRKKDQMCEFHNLSKIADDDLDPVCASLDIHALLESVQIELLRNLHGHYHTVRGELHEQQKETDTDKTEPDS
jgi:hypothetical protein